MAKEVKCQLQFLATGICLFHAEPIDRMEPLLRYSGAMRIHEKNKKGAMKWVLQMVLRLTHLAGASSWA